MFQEIMRIGGVIVDGDQQSLFAPIASIGICECFSRGVT